MFHNPILMNKIKLYEIPTLLPDEYLVALKMDTKCIIIL